MPVLFAANRLEILPVLQLWLSKGNNRWIVFDRTKRTAEAYASVYGDFGPEWTSSLDRYFPDPEVGIYLRKPLEESIATIGIRGPVEADFRNKLDQNRELQKSAREEFQRIVSENENWHEVDASGFATTDQEFTTWEIEVGSSIWMTVTRAIGREEWLKDTEGLVKKSRLGFYRSRTETAFRVQNERILSGLWIEHSDQISHSRQERV